MASASAQFADGKAYERMMGRWSQRAGVGFLDWLALPDGLRWLDVGCGNGAFTETMMARAKPSAAVGVDPSEGQIEYARKRPGTQGAQFRVAGAQQLPFDSGSFDVAVMALVISFVPDPVQAVRELARVVKPGGCVATYMWDVPAGGLPLEPIRKALAAIGVAPASPPGFQAARESAMREAWTKAGLQSVETTVIWIRIEFANFDDFWESNTLPIGPDGAAVNALSPEQKGRFRTQLLQQLKSGPDGSIGYEAFANAVKGRVPG